jgi:hypothetical protein
VRLILGLSQYDLHCADDRPCCVFGGKHEAFAAGNTRRYIAPIRGRFAAGHWQHEADGRTAFDAVDEHVAQALDVAITERLQISNLNSARQSIASARAPVR